MLIQQLKGSAYNKLVIANLALSIGFLALSYLNHSDLMNNQSSKNKLIAINHASDIFEIMRSDQDNVRSGSYNISLGEDAPLLRHSAKRKLAAWFSRIKETLPQSDASIDCWVMKKIDRTQCEILILWKAAPENGVMNLARYH